MSEESPETESPKVHYEHGIPVLPTPADQAKAKEQAAKDTERAYKDRQITLDGRMVFFTGALFICTLITAGIGGFQACIANKSANAAKSAAETARDALQISERPWVSLEEHIASGLEFQKNLAEITLIHTTNNYGITPAINARTDFELVERQKFGDPQKYGDITEAERFCDTLLPLQKGKTDEWILVNRQTIFPKVPTQTESFAGVVTHPMGNDKAIMPLVISCVVYQSSFTSEWYRTWKIYSVMVPSNGPQHYAFPTAEKDIPQENLALMPWVHPDHSN